MTVIHQTCREADTDDYPTIFHDAELKEDSDGDLYVSIPYDFYGAVEIETYETPKSLWFTLHRRGWDRTGGMSTDEEIGETKLPYLIFVMAAEEIRQHDLKERKAQAALESVQEVTE